MKDTMYQRTWKIWYNGLAYLENKVQWTRVPGKTGTIQYFTNINMLRAPAKSGLVYLENMV